jgi:hypothetical protein
MILFFNSLWWKLDQQQLSNSVVAWGGFNKKKKNKSNSVD